MPTTDERRWWYGPRPMVPAIDVDVLQLPTTPLQVLVIGVLLAVLVAVVIMALTFAGSPLVDKRWPADEPLDPTEMLWGESGGYIQRHFQGLEVETAKDLATQFVEVKVPAGAYIVEQGDPATHFYVLKEGEAEVIQRVATGGSGGAAGLVREDVIRRHGPGDSFGELGILRRTARTASIRAIRDCTVLQLAAEDFVAGAAFSAAEDNELLSRVDRYMREDKDRSAATGALRRLDLPATGPGAATGAVAAALTADPAPAPAAPAAAAPTTADAGPAVADTTAEPAAASTGLAPEALPAPTFAPSHVVPPSGLLAWAAPDALMAPVAQLAAGVELLVVGEAGAWARVVGANGWEGWVDGRALVAR